MVNMGEIETIVLLVYAHGEAKNLLVDYYDDQMKPLKLFDHS